jgi:ubiquitin carboxyl-terminal hydrolase L5
LDTLKPIHALIFLFKYLDGEDGQQTTGIEVEPLESGVWFANQASGQAMILDHNNPAQVINNSCGTLAALNAVSV